MDGRIQIDDRRVLNTLNALRELSGGRAMPVMQDIGRYLKTSTQLRFRQQRGPEGQRWAPSQRAKAQGGQTLRDTNRLFRSITFRATPGAVEVGTNVIYGAVHQFGIHEVVQVKAHRRTTRKTHGDRGAVSVRSTPVKAHTRWLSMPERPYLGFSRADRAEILTILREGIVALARK